MKSIKSTILLLLLSIPFTAASAQHLTGRGATLVGGASGKDWYAASAPTIDRVGGLDWSRITFRSDMSFLAIGVNVQTSGRWSLSGDQKKIYLYDLASGNWKSPDTVTIVLSSLTGSSFAGQRIDATGASTSVRYYATASGARSKATRKRSARSRRTSK